MAMVKPSPASPQPSPTAGAFTEPCSIPTSDVTHQVENDFSFGPRRWCSADPALAFYYTLSSELPFCISALATLATPFIF